MILSINWIEIMEIIFYHVLESYADFFYSRKCFSQLILLLIFEWVSPRLIFSLRRENSDSISTLYLIINASIN